MFLYMSLYFVFRNTPKAADCGTSFGGKGAGKSGGKAFGGRGNRLFHYEKTFPLGNLILLTLINITNI